MQERTVLLVVVVLVVSTAAAGAAVNLLRPNDASSWQAFSLSVAWDGTATVGSPINVTVTIRAAMLDPRTLPLLFLCLDVGTMNVSAATPGTNPWGYPTVWNLTGEALSSPAQFNATLVPTESGTNWLYGMAWVPLGDVRSVPIDASGHVNPAGVTLEAVASEAVTVTAAA